MIGIEKEIDPRAYMAFKFAVQTCLIRFYAKPEAEAEAVVEAWWGHVRSLDDGLDALILHDEPINVAADLSKGEEVPITPENEAIYDAIRNEAEHWAYADRTEEFTLPRRVA
jgi:hypothetical protein